MHVQALSSSQAYIYEERGRLLQLQAENDDLRVQEGEDRARIEQLLRLLDAQATAGSKPRAAAAAAGARAGPCALEEAAAKADVLKMRVQALQAQLVDQVTLQDRSCLV